MSHFAVPRHSPPPTNQHRYPTRNTFEDTSWNGASFKLPVKVDCHQPSDGKQQFFTQTVKAIIEQMSASAQTKCRVQQGLFKFNNHINEAETRLRNLLMHMPGHTPIILLEHESFHFNDIEVTTRQGQPVEFNPQAAALTLAQCRSICVIMLRLETDIQAAYPGNEEEAVKAKFSNALFNVAMHLPALGVDNQAMLHAGITPAMLTNPWQLLLFMCEESAKQTEIGIYQVCNANLVSIDTNLFDKLFTKQVYEQISKLQKVLICRDYQGIDHFDCSQVQNTLGNIKQVHYDSTRGQLVTCTISEFYIE